MSATVARASLPAVRVATVEGRRRPFGWGNLLVHALLLVSVSVIAFPLYYCFVISTQALDEVIQRPPVLVPSSYLVENYAEAWRRSQMGRLLINSTIVAVGVAVG